MPRTVDTAATGDVITLDEVKDHINMDRSNSAFDNKLTALRDTAVQMARDKTNRQFLTATYSWSFDGFKRHMYLPDPPLQSVDKVEYRDEDGNWQTIDTARYQVYTSVEPGYVRFNNDYDWPELYEDEDYPVRITYTCGYNSASDIPSPIKLWIKNTIGSYWLSPEGQKVGVDVTELQSHMDRLMQGQIVARFG